MLQASSVIRSVPSLMPHPALPQADWGDAFATETTATNARAALEQMLRQGGGWPTALLALRNRLASLVGLKPATFTLGGETGFPIVSETSDEIVLGFNDSHLDFRILVTLLPTTPRQMRVATLVDRHGWAGKAYIGLIGSTHKRIVRRLMARQTEI